MIFLNKYSEYVSLNEGIKEVVELYKNNQQLYKILTDNNSKLLNRLISIDPTANMEKDVAGKYTKWLMYRDWETDRKSTRLNSSHSAKSRMPSSA